MREHLEFTAFSNKSFPQGIYPNLTESCQGSSWSSSQSLYKTSAVEDDKEIDHRLLKTQGETAVWTLFDSWAVDPKGPAKPH